MGFRPVTPYLTVDGVIELYDGEFFKGIVLVERLNEPQGLALPGGFVDVGETVEQALTREMKEETGLDVQSLHLLNIYSDPARDSRFHTASAVFIVSAQGFPVAQDDAKSLSIYPINNLPIDQLVFDHKDIVLDYLKLKGGLPGNPP